VKKATKALIEGRLKTLEAKRDGHVKDAQWHQCKARIEWAALKDVDSEIVALKADLRK
jgi:hypothetical protein